MEGFEREEMIAHGDHKPKYCASQDPNFMEEGGSESELSHAFSSSKEKSREMRRDLNMRHLGFLALGSGIGTGLFMGSGNILYDGGPGSLMISFVMLGFMVITVIFAIGELVSVFPASSSYAHLLTRFVHPSFGFAVGMNYLTTWLIILPTELTVSCMTISYWDKDEVVPKGVWVAIILVVVFGTNLFGVRFFGEFEMLTTSIKMLGCIGFIIACIVIACGGAPNNYHVGAQYWHDPGSFKNHFKGFCSAFEFAALAYGGTEIIGVTVGEAAHPRRHLPKAAKFVVYRVLIFFILCLFMITLLVPSTNFNITEYSPFVVALEQGKIHALPQIFNAVILISFISVSNAAVFTASRLTYNMAENNFLPKIFLYSDRQGRPLMGYLGVFLFGLLGFLVYSSSEEMVFKWLGSISGMSVILLWLCISLAHIRFRFAWKRAGYTVKDLPWASPLGVWGSIFSFLLNVFVLVAVFYISVFPIGEGDMDSEDRVKAFFQSYLSVIIMMFSFGVHMVITRSRFVRMDEIDLTTGRRDVTEDDDEAWQNEKSQPKSRWKHVLNFLF